MVYTITTNTKKQYTVHSPALVPLDSVWLSQKYLFTPGQWVTIADETGKTKTYCS